MRVILLAIVLVLIALIAVLLIRPRPRLASTATPVAFEVTIEGEALTQVSPRARVLPVSSKQPRDITPADIDYITARAGQPVLVFKDGSELFVSPGIFNQLPATIQQRLRYARQE
jgi:hypothetical protein